jgi:hypothetical protein
MANTAHEILDAVKSLSVDELRTLNRFVVDLINAKGREAAQQFRVGSFVQLKDKRGFPIYAQVTRFLSKNIELRATNGLTYRASPSLLKPWDGLLSGKPWDWRTSQPFQF